MPDYDPDNSAHRVARHRLHANGDHSECLYKTCRERQEIELQAEEKFIAVAIFEELERRGIDPERFWPTIYGISVADAAAMANAVLPDYDYVITEVNFIHRGIARQFVMRVA
jgi:hypothetical protein